MLENGDRKDRESFEDGLGGLMKQAGEEFSVAGRPLLDGGVARGRRRTVLRRSAAVTGSVAALAAIGLGGSFVTGGIGSSQNGGEVGGASSALSPVAGTLAALLPEGQLSEQPVGGGGDTDDRKRPRPEGVASVVYDDGHGKAALSVTLNREDPGRPNKDELSCPDSNLNTFEACSATTLKDGSRLVLFKGWEYPDRREETKWWYADLLTPEGYRISVSEWNAPAEKDAPVSRSTPPLSLDRMKELVRAEEWRPLAASLPAPEKQAPAQPVKGLSGAVILDRLTAQLPDGLEVKASGKQETEAAYVVVDDGRGRSLVQINVQPDMSDVEGDLFGAGTEVLPDGTKVVTREGPGEKGGEGVKMREVDTIRPDGLRVVISAFNTANQNEAATRAEPALTLAQLRKIATSKVWRK
ncbi:hypothetical protein [Streptomyces sp. OR43]|uniref:hypothetical protein n=1 Tax=Streptomyces sp. or43 TaxID=2478957 RepID=UPI0011CD8F02|nr:hypothetical protein [Streptomyces sp. or43]TXS41948.1 hypothetical protein EAO72_15965 [Streptomyces sp. or43]